MSDSDITAEIWWERELVTDELDEMCDRIAAGLGVPRSNIGAKGNEVHLRGSHRSQEWIKNSVFCTNRTYTVQAGLTADQLRHIAGVDIIPGKWGTADNRRKTAEITARLIAAMRAGLLPEVFEVYGAAADLTTVTGWNNRENRSASSDSSHLDHPHLGIDRTKLRDRAVLARIAAIVLGDDMEQTDPLVRRTGNPKRTIGDVLADLSNLRDWLYAVPGAQAVNPPPAGSRAALLFDASQRPPVDVDEQALADALAPHLPEGADPAEIAAAVVARFAAELKPSEG